MSEENKQRLKDYQKNYHDSRKSQCNSKSNSFLINYNYDFNNYTNKIVFSLLFNSGCYLVVHY